MIQTLLIIFLLQGQAFKDFDQDAKKELEQKHYAKAFELFQEAYRLQPKAKNYRVEGNYIDAYLPLYSMALCQEHLDIITAGEWARKSQTALESDVLKKNRRARAKYHKKILEIIRKAEDESTTRRRAFRRQLDDAESLLRNQKFSAARRAYEKLELAYPKSTEPESGRKSVALAETQFLNDKTQMFHLALDAEQISTCESLLSTIKASFPDRDLSSWSRDIERLRKKIADREAQKKNEPEEQNTVAINHQQHTSTPDLTETQPVVKQKQRKEPALGHNDNSKESLAKLPNRAQIRKHLLDSLAFYRRSGDVKQALDKLIRECPPDGIRYPSYHWIQAILLAALFDETGNDDTRKACEMEIQTVLSSDIQVAPDSQSYSTTFIDIYQRAKEELKP